MLVVVCLVFSPGIAFSFADDAFFADTLYPAMKSAQCDLCHNDNGVASAYGIEFPAKSASRDQITAFGLKLVDYVDREHPDRSLLLAKPTNREEHTGGVRILVGSKEEKHLREWIDHLIAKTDADWRVAKELIERADKWSLQPQTIRRLTHTQYNNTVRDLLGDQSQPANRFPKEDFIHGFRNQREGQGVSPLQAEAYSESAERLARAAFRGGDQQGLVETEPKSPEDRDAALGFVRRFGMKAFRRPLTDEDVEKYVRLHLASSKRANDFFLGAATVVEAMLQSPNFLFHIEGAHKGNRQSYTVVNRLAYLLWDTMPSDEMLRRAELNEYDRIENIERLAKQMLEDPKAILAMDEFLAQWMRFDSVLGASRDRRRYRDFNNEVAAAMVEETRQLFRHLVWNDQNFMEFFSAEYTFINSSLAQLYGLPAPSEDFARVEYPKDSGRAGVLGHGSFLVLTSKPSETSPTARGLFVRNHFLAQEIAPPPPGVNSVLPEIAEDKPMTNRQRLDLHLNSEACAGCHRLIDPIGLGLEQYDAIGRYQAKMQLRFGGRDNPNTKELELDTTAQIQGIMDSMFSSPRELGKLLASNETCQRCIVKQFFRYAFGREETMADQAILEEVFIRFRDSGFRFRELVLAIVTSKLFIQTAKMDP
ncbi:MAG: DUF1592 domain-containing protein [Pirellula sp.]